MLITLSGIDCSGKSTQLELLTGALRDQGRRVRTLWFRPGYSPEMDELRRLVRAIRPDVIPAPGPSAKRRETFARPAVARSWVAMAITDTVLQYAFKLRRWLWAGWDVICDRYLLDARLDLQLRFPEQGAAVSIGAEIAAQLCPRPDISFLLTLPHDEMCRRMAIKAEPYPDPPELRDVRYERYIALGKTTAVTEIAADRPVGDVHADLLQRTLEARR
ncbi:MAG: hypothetical protein RIF41_28785 [Polyangiaceae bacterium]